MGADLPPQDTRLARLLHHRERLPLPLLLTLLEEARRSGARLSELIAREGLAEPAEIASWLAALEPEAPPPPPGRWRVGEVVEGLRIEAKLGEGGMGAVYRALDLASGAQVAVKTLGASAEAEDRIRFEREGEAQAAVDAHPNVLGVHRGGVAQGRAFLVMELASGGDLTQRLAQPLAPRRAAALVRELALGLSHVHAQGVLHRDLKPSNVVFDERGTPKLADFGLARAEGAETLTQTGTIVGTPGYMAPEQVHGKPGLVGEAADVYGLGALLYHCLTGSPPFSGSMYTVLLAVLESPPPPLSTPGREIPSGLERICLKALEKEPSQRQASAADLAAELEAFLASEDGGSSPATPLALPLVLLALTALVVLAAWGLGAEPPPSDRPAASPSAERPLTPAERAEALEREAHRLVSRGDFTQALAAIDSALALPPPSAGEPELQIFRSQLLLANQELAQLPGALPKSDLPLLELTRRRLALQGEEVEVLKWKELRARANELARDAINTAGTDWLVEVVREQVAEVLFSLMFQSPKGSRNLLEPWVRSELPALLQADDPRIKIAWGVVAVSRRDEFFGKMPLIEVNEGLEDLEPRWRANLEALRILSNPDRRATGSIFARLAECGPPLFAGSEQISTPLEALAQLRISHEVTETAEHRAFAPLKAGLPIDEAAFRIALAHRERAFVRCRDFTLEARYLLGAQVRYEELQVCLGVPIDAPILQGGRTETLVRSRLVRAESALDRGDAERARTYLDQINAERGPLDERTLRARLQALEGDREGALARLDELAKGDPATMFPTRSVEVTRRIISGDDPRVQLRRGLGK